MKRNKTHRSWNFSTKPPRRLVARKGSEVLILLMQFLLFLEMILYKVQSYFAIYLNNGTHPKIPIIQYDDFFVEHIPKNARVLDIGCGKGFLAFAVAKRREDITIDAIDIINENIVQAKKRHKLSRVSYILGDATTYNFKNKYQAIILSNVLEHIEQRIVFLKKISKISKKVLIRVPTYDREWRTPYMHALGVDFRLDPTHYIEYTDGVFRSEITQAGGKVVSLQRKFGEIYAVVSF